jgi:hypothetical protein
MQKLGTARENECLEESDQLDESSGNHDNEDGVELVDEDQNLFDESWKSAVADPENLCREKMRLKALNHWRQESMKRWRF